MIAALLTTAADTGGVAPVWEWDLLTWVCVATWALVVLAAICAAIKDAGRGGPR